MFQNTVDAEDEVEEGFSTPLKPRRGRDRSGASPNVGVGSFGAVAEETVPPVSGLAVEGTQAAPKGARRKKVATVSLPLVSVADFRRNRTDSFWSVLPL